VFPDNSTHYATRLTPSGKPARRHNDFNQPPSQNGNFAALGVQNHELVIPGEKIRFELKGKVCANEMRMKGRRHWFRQDFLRG
jgi:hypothetical protein